jgi:hypothetical protein
MDLLGIQCNAEKVRKYTLFWWYNVRGASGLRLTKPGYFTLTKEVKLKEYRLNLSTQSITGKQRLYLDLDNCMPSPYYIHANKMGRLKKYMNISIFDEKLATMFYLNGHDLGKYLESMKIANSSDF